MMRCERNPAVEPYARTQTTYASALRRCCSNFAVMYWRSDSNRLCLHCVIPLECEPCYRPQPLGTQL